MKTMPPKLFILFTLFISGSVFSPHRLYAQAEVMGWGNLQGIRIEGELMEFNTSICVLDNNGNLAARTGKEKQERPGYSVNGNKEILTTRIDSLFITQTVTNTGPGKAELEVEITSREAASYRGVYLCLELPSKYYSGESIRLIGEESAVDEISANSEHRSLRMQLHNPAGTSVETSPDGNPLIYIELIAGSPAADQTVANTFTFETKGTINKKPVLISIDRDRPGRRFDGLGGNFRLQNPRMDPKVIDYNLDNLRVSMARLQMRWWNWHPDENTNPLEEAQKGNVHPQVRAELELAQRFAKNDIPVLLAIWTAPEWAIKGERAWGPTPDGIWGNPLDQEKAEQIYKSIASYIIFLKEEYGVEVEYFSFNESDLGINVRQTANQHAKFIKEFGAYLSSQGLKTKLLLGDTADANGWAFLEAAMDDPETHKYIGAVSFHSWRGWDYETLQKWNDAATRMNVPLIVGEGSTDAAAWRFPVIFDQSTFAQQEITLYTRILNICEPLAILQWQLTSDYSILAGGGLFGNNSEELRPTQRFWNLKQISKTPAGSFALPSENNSETIFTAAFGEIAKNLYTVHIVNNGAERETTVTGIPDSVSEMEIYYTSDVHNMEKIETVSVENGSVTFSMPPLGFASMYTLK